MRTPNGVLAHREITPAPNSAAAVGANADDDVDAADFGADGRGRQTADRKMVGRNVAQFAGALAKEVVVVRCVGVEIGTPRLNQGLAQQPGFGELMQRIVHGRQRHFDPGGHDLAMEMLRGDVSIAGLEQQPSQCQPLPCRP